MNRKTIYSTHIGAASIMLIFMVLSLVSFAALTVVNSRADYRLSEKMQERSISYYNACHEANAFIAETATMLQNEYDLCPQEKDFTDQLNNTEFSKSINLNNHQTLDITLKAVTPTDGNSILYEIKSYKVTTNDENIELDESLPVMQ